MLLYLCSSRGILLLILLLLCSTSSGVGLVLIEPSQLSYFSRDMLHGYPDDFERYVGALDLGSDMTGFYEYNMQKKLMLN